MYEYTRDVDLTINILSVLHIKLFKKSTSQRSCL